MNAPHVLSGWRRLASAALGSLLLFSASLRADVVFAWNEAFLQFFAASTVALPPQVEARAFAMMHLAVHDALVAASREPASDDTRLVVLRSAAVSAAHAVSLAVLPQGRGRFDALAARHLAALPDGPAKTRGVGAGRAAAESVLRKREADGWLEPALATALDRPGTEGAESAIAVLARGRELPSSPWLKARPFVLKTAKQFAAEEPATMLRDGEWVANAALHYSKVFDAVDRTAAAEAGGLFWTQRPFAAWNRIARQVAATRGLDLLEQARLLAVLNVAMADATLAALHWSHTIGTWRSIATEAWRGLDGEPPMATDVAARVDDREEPTWVRPESHVVLIPPQPGFPALAASVAGAAQAALTRVFTDRPLSFQLPAPAVSAAAEGAQAQPRRFDSIAAAAKECAFASSLDGHHSREGAVAGYSLGLAVGGYVAKRALTAR